MLVPVGDTPNPRVTPYVTWALMAVNVAVYLAVTLPLSATRPELSDPRLFEYLLTFTDNRFVLSELARSVSSYDLLVFQYGFRPAEPSLLSLLTAMFLHGGFMHLAGNMLFLWIFGDNVEHRLGPVAFLATYLGTGVVATLVFALFALDSPYPMIGASGAISGVLGCYFVWFPRNRVRTFVFLFPIFMQTVLIPARWVLGFYILIDNLLPFLGNAGSETGVAYGAHIGGFVAGAGLAWAVDRRPWTRMVGAVRQGGASVNSKDSPAEDDFVGLVRSGNYRDALAGYAGMDRGERRELPSGALLQLGEVLLEQRQHFAALSLFRQFISERPADPEIDRAFLGAGQALMLQPRGATSAYHYFLSAIDTARQPEVAAEARLNLEKISSNGR